ncbi:hypothetical protein EVAR_74691_1 [Eumeta japonica]|uniref:Secreted protein n=1 Tax=Eumeta variegata TaxID=151549 RepID=A0A4C1YNI5_EUMVA|nr:hypothetical protein EVAR_74691_1 [Eumeta japonica]
MCIVASVVVLLSASESSGGQYLPYPPPPNSLITLIFYFLPRGRPPERSDYHYVRFVIPQLRHTRVSGSPGFVNRPCRPRPKGGRFQKIIILESRTHRPMEWKKDRCVTTSRTLRPIVPLYRLFRALARTLGSDGT